MAIMVSQALQQRLSVEDQICPRILVVDDDEDACTFFKTCLEDKRFHVVVYHSPLKALSSFKQNFFDLLIIDIRMPKMNGFELSEKIKKIDPQAKVCFITAFEEYYDSLKEQFPTLDARCFIKKPITAQGLIDRVMTEIISKG